jgi:hypothetical protein
MNPLAGTITCQNDFITGACVDRTLMRHFIVRRRRRSRRRCGAGRPTDPVSPLALGMAEPSGPTLLIALARLTDRGAPGVVGTVRRTMDLTTVTATTDHDLYTAAGTEIQAGRGWHGNSRWRRESRDWTEARFRSILTLRSLCGAWRYGTGCDLPILAGAVPVSPAFFGCSSPSAFRHPACAVDPPPDPLYCRHDDVMVRFIMPPVACPPGNRQRQITADLGWRLHTGQISSKK